MYSITLQNAGGDNVITSGDIIGRLNYAVPAESDGSAATYIVADVLCVAEGAFTSSSNPAALTIGTSASDSAAATERVRISASGNVGIGTASTNYKLGVAGDGKFDEGLTVSSGVILPNAVPSSTTNALYNDGGTLKFNGNALSATSALVNTIDGRLTLETGVAASTTDQTSKTTLYFTPYKGNQIALYDGSNWGIHTLTERSLSLSGYTAGKNFDIFIYDNGGTLTLESVVWTNDSTRATALTTQDGVYVKNGATTRRYLGTIRTTSSTGQCEDSEDRRFVWNYYNQTRRRMASKLGSATSTHSYTTNAWRAYYNSTTVGTSRNEFVIGLDQLTRSDIMASFRYGYIAFAYDSATVPIEGDAAATDGNQSDLNSHAYFSAKMLADGYHYVQAMQYGAGSTSLFHYMTMETHILC